MEQYSLGNSLGNLSAAASSRLPHPALPLTPSDAPSSDGISYSFACQHKSSQDEHCGELMATASEGDSAQTGDDADEGMAQRKLTDLPIHYFCEVSGELLAKPSALSDMHEAEGLPPTLLFCNSPSDADFVEVLLKKRGIGAAKLIGYVPPPKAARALERLAAKEVSVLVVTDIAARGLNLHDFKVVVNYSVPNDPDIYLQRSGLAASGDSDDKIKFVQAKSGQPGRVVSIVSPLDIANFHYLKKAVELDFRKLELPTAADLLRARADNFQRQAVDKFGLWDENLRQLAAELIKGKDSTAVMAMLLHNTLEVIPQLHANLDKASFERDFPDEDEEERRDDGGRGRRHAGRERSWHDRDHRRGSGSSRDDRGHDYQGASDDQYAEEQYTENRIRSERGGRKNGRDREYYDVPRVKEDRLYIGQGYASGLNQDHLLSAITQNCGVAADNVHRISVREQYAFIDVPEELSSKVVDGLNNSEGPQGNKLFVKKAITIVSAREPGPEEAEFGDHERDSETEPQTYVDETGEQV